MHFVYNKNSPILTFFDAVLVYINLAKRFCRPGGERSFQWSTTGETKRRGHASPTLGLATGEAVSAVARPDRWRAKLAHELKLIPFAIDFVAQKYRIYLRGVPEWCHRSERVRRRTARGVFEWS